MSGSLFARPASMARRRLSSSVAEERRYTLEIEGISAGGMPSRVKCLHVLVAHSLAVGPGVNPLGDEAVDLLPKWWERSPCAQALAPEGE